MSYKYKRIMIIDDDEIDNYLTKSLISNNNYAEEVLEFNNGSDAFDYLEKHKDNESKLPELILLDLHMPRMDGIEFLDKLNTISNNLLEGIVCVVSGSIDDNAILKSKLNSYVSFYTKKPITVEFLDSIKK